MNSRCLPAGTFLLLFLLVLHIPVFGTEAVRRVSIIAAIESAVMSDPHMDYLRRTYTEEMKRRSSFIRLHMPSFTVGYSGRESYGLFAPYSLTHTLSAGIQLPIAAADSSSRLVEREHLLELRKLELMMTERRYDLIREILSLSLELLLYRREIDLYCRLLALQKSRLETSSCLRELGEISAGEYNSILIETRQRRLDLEGSELQLAGLRRNFSVLVCTDAEELYRPEGNLRGKSPPPMDGEIPGEIDFFQKNARTGNIRLRETIIERESLEIDAARRRRRYIPAVDLFGAFQLTGELFPPHLPAFSIGVHISSSGPLLRMEAGDRIERSRSAYLQEPSSEMRIDTGALFREVCTIDSEISYSERQRRWRETQVEIQVKRIYGEILMLHKRHELYLRRADAAADELSLAGRRKALGQISLRELMETEINFTKYQLEVYRSCTDCCLKELDLMLVCGLEEYLPVLVRRYIDSGETEDASH